jgi:hypothetical protein
MAYWEATEIILICIASALFSEGNHECLSCFKLQVTIGIFASCLMRDVCCAPFEFHHQPSAGCSSTGARTISVWSKASNLWGRSVRLRVCLFPDSKLAFFVSLTFLNRARVCAPSEDQLTRSRPSRPMRRAPRATRRRLPPLMSN